MSIITHPYTPSLARDFTHDGTPYRALPYKQGGIVLNLTTRAIIRSTHSREVYAGWLATIDAAEAQDKASVSLESTPCTEDAIDFSSILPIRFE